MPYPLERCPYCKEELEQDFPAHWEEEHGPEDGYAGYREETNVDAET